MKKIVSILVFASSLFSVQAQNGFDGLLEAGIDNAKQFSQGYLQPGSEALIYTMNNGWYNSAEAKPMLGFEISIIGNISTINNNHKTFTVNEADYSGISFQSGSTSQNVATVFGANNPDVVVAYTYQNPITGLNETINLTLPNGLGEEGVDFVPAGFVQASVGLVKGLEVKARFLPQIEIDDSKIGLYGAGLQYEFTKLLPADKVLPIAISGLVAYTRLDGEYDITDESGIDGSNQKIVNESSSWLFSAIVSTKMPVINFYGGIGYLKGNADTYLKGEYRVDRGPLLAQGTVVDPFMVSHDVSGIRANLGAKLKLGFFRLHADYTFAEFNSASVGINFGFR